MTKLAELISIRHHKIERDGARSATIARIFTISLQKAAHLLESTISPLTPALTRHQLFERVDSAQPSIAVFDCDGTLWAGDAGAEFMRWSMDSGLLSRDASEWMDNRYREYLRGDVSEVAICAEMVQIYRGLREAELRHACRHFFETTVHPNIFPEMKDLCHRLLDRGAVLWAVSSTNNWLIEDAVTNFGIPAERVLAATVRIAKGVITDELLDVPTDEGKAQSLLRAGVSRPDVVFGNSIHDVAMLSLARHPFAVNPTAALTQLAAANSWPVFHPAPRNG
jgi:phosphoserine phosphatase